MEEKKKIDSKSIVGRFAYSNRRFGGLRNSSKGGKTKSKETSAEKIADTDSATGKGGELSAGKSGNNRDSSGNKKGGLSSLLRSRAGRSGQRASQQQSPAALPKSAISANNEGDADFDADEDIHEPKNGQPNLQINSPLHGKSKGSSGSGGQVIGDGMQPRMSGDRQDAAMVNQDDAGAVQSADVMGNGPSETDADAGQSPTLQKVPAAQKAQQKLTKDNGKNQKKSMTKRDSSDGDKQSPQHLSGVRAGGQKNQMQGSASVQVIGSLKAGGNQLSHSQSQVNQSQSSVHQSSLQQQQQITGGNRISIIGGGAAGNAGTQQNQQQTLAAPVGRRLDQVQTRRRRMKNARAMKVLYWHVDGLANNFTPGNPNFDESRDVGGMSMEFQEAPKQFNQEGKQVKRLKLIDVLIDLKVSVEKIDKQVILAEDGNLYKIETIQDLEDPSNPSSQNNSPDQVIINENSQSQVNLSHSGGASSGDVSPINSSAQGNSQHLSFLSNTNQKVSILQVKFIHDEGPTSKQNQRNPGAIKSSVTSNRAADKVLDIGITRNGMVYATEKGEAYIALAMKYQVAGISQLDSSDYYVNVLYASKGQAKKMMDTQQAKNDNVDDPILLEEQEIKTAKLMASNPHTKNQLNEFDMNDVNMGEQFDHMGEDNDLVAAKNYFNDFRLPLITIPLKQIQSTFISKVACGLEHTLLLTSSGFVYSMGRNTWGQLGGEQGLEPSSPENADGSLGQEGQGQPDLNQSFSPQMVFSLLNTKVTEIQCGYYHSIAIGTPRSNTAAFTGSGGGGGSYSSPMQDQINSPADNGNKLYQGYSEYGSRSRSQKQMVFSWGRNDNHQLGLFPMQREQVSQVNEPTVIQELLQYNCIRKSKCQGNSTLVLVDQPNTLLVFSKRHTQQRSTDTIPQEIQDGQYKQQINYVSLTMIQPNQDDGELIVDFVLIDKPKSSHFDSIESEKAGLHDNAILYNTNYSDVFLYRLNDEQNQTPKKLVYNNQSNKSLINDHYMSSMVYLPSPVDKLFTVSQMRPDIAWQEKQKEKEVKDKDMDGQQQAGYAGAPGVGITTSQSQTSTHPAFAYPFHSFILDNDDDYCSESYGSSYSGSMRSPDGPQNDQAVFGNANFAGKGPRPGIQKGQKQIQQQQPPQSVSKTLGSVFSSEWKDLMKFIAVSKGSTKVPKGMEPMSYRPNNLPKQSDEEVKKVNKLVEQNRIEYLKKQQQKKDEATKKIQMQIQKEERLAKIWEKEILDDWDNMKSTSKCRELWTEGIPKRIRAIVWYRAIGNKSVVSKSLFNIMADRGRKLSELLDKNQKLENDIMENRGNPADVEQKIANLKQSQAGGDQQSTQVDNNNSKELMTKDTEQDSEVLEELYLKYYKIRKKLLMLIQIDSPSYSVQQREKSISLIEQDIRRTFSDLTLFQEGMKYHDSIQKILRAFAMYRPDIGYVQGMSYIAAIVILYIGDEYKAFMNFANLMLKYPIMPFYTFNEDFVAQCLQLFKQLFQINLPDLCDHFEMEEIKPRQYVYKWIMTLFSRSLPLRIVSHVWDLYFLDGIFILYQTSIAILRLLRPKLLQEDMEGILYILQNVENYITEEDEDKLVDSIFNLVYPQWVYEEIPKLEINHQNQFN